MVRWVRPGTKRWPYKKKWVEVQETVPSASMEETSISQPDVKKRWRPKKWFYDYVIESSKERDWDTQEMKNKIDKFINEWYDSIWEIDVEDLDVLVTEKNEETPVVNASEIFSENEIDMEMDMTSFEWYEMFNVTWHDIITRDWIVIKSVARSRVAETTTIEWYIYKVALFKNIDTKKVVPKRVDKRFYIVSSKVAQACPDRDDLLIPYEYNISRGNCLGLMRNPFYINNK